MENNDEKRLLKVFNYDVKKLIEYFRIQAERAKTTEIKDRLVKRADSLEERLKKGEVFAMPVDKKFIPKNIKKHLDKYVIGQDRAKKVLAVAAYKHMIRYSLSNVEGKSFKPAKNNVLFIGGTGTGKTYMCQILSKYLSLPFSITDLSRMSQSGYVGDDTRAITRNLSASARGSSHKKLQHGIILLDEIDKLADQKADETNVSTTGVQYELLKMIEGAQDEYVDTTENILFIAAGAFRGKIKEHQEVTEKSMGFIGGEKTETISVPINEQLVEYGLIPELVGRFQNGATLDSLSKDDLVTIMKTSEDSILKNFVDLFEYEGIKLHFTEGALLEIADVAIEKGTGARALNSALEILLQDLQFEYLGTEQTDEIKVTKNTVVKALRS